MDAKERGTNTSNDAMNNGRQNYDRIAEFLIDAGWRSYDAASQTLDSIKAAESAKQWLTKVTTCHCHRPSYRRRS